MKILIAGSGDTGTYLAKSLSYENQDVVMMSTDKEYLAGLDSSHNLMVNIGRADSVPDLVSAGADSADLFIAVTPSESVNLVACQIARFLGAKNCVARIENKYLLEKRVSEMFSSHGVDTLIYPEKLVASEIMAFIDRNWVTKWFELHAGELVLAGVRINAGSEICGKQLKDLQPISGFFHVAAIRRRRKLIIPHGDDFLLDGDLAYFTIRPENEAQLARITGHTVRKLKNVMVSGGGKITYLLAEMMRGRCNMTIIEPDRERCTLLAETYPDVTVVNAEVKDFSALREEEISGMDLFLALSDSTETNIVACMVAKEFGVKRTVVQIEDIPYMWEAENLGIDKIVNKKLTTTGAILKYILGLDIQVGHILSLEDAEVVEIEVNKGARITGAPVKDLKLPSGLTLGGLIREGKGMLISGSTEIIPGDRVMVFFTPGSLLKVRHLFK